MKQKSHTWIYRNSLSLVMFLFFFIFLLGQTITGWNQYNEKMTELKGPYVYFLDYISSGHFVESTFENWESEFLQMAVYVLFTVFLRQKGSAESKSLDKKEEVDREPQPHENAPWPVKKGGILLAIYKYSLSIILFLLFIISFTLHTLGSLNEYNTEQRLKGLPTETLGGFLINSKLWFESFQNWQSEFISVLSIVILSIFLRQKGSPESKPVDAPNSETGK